MKAKFEARDYGYTIISRFEKSIRNACCEKLDALDEDPLTNIPTGVVEAAQKRNEGISGLSELLESIDFIHLKEIILYKGNYMLFFSEEIFLKEKFIDIMQSLYALRCKIAHIRDYFTYADLNQLINEVKEIQHFIKYEDKDLECFLDAIMDKPQDLVEKIPITFFEEEQRLQIINNLPVADYEYEGGFVGRADDKANIIKMIKAENHRVITISGAGGVGKSALVLNIVNEIIRNEVVKYDFVIWVSAKENKLSCLGIEDIEPTLKNYEELLDTILEVLEFDVSEYNDDVERKEEDINIIFDACEKVLLIIDNLETITDERIINFILDSHPKTNFLITSRKGLGQVERRYELKQLREKDAIHLFRVVCKEKQLIDLSKADEQIIKKYVNKVYCYPLAIKWMIGQVSLGKDINEIVERINEQSSDISKFCFEEIFNNLSKEARYVLYTLSLYDESVSKGILRYISNLSDVDFEDAIQELVLVSLILPEQQINKENAEINSFYSLLPLTRGYVKTQIDSQPELKSQIQERIVTVDVTLEEAERAKKQYRFSMSNYGATTEEEKIASMIAQTAYQKYQTNNYLEAVELYKKAVSIAPRFASIYRNWAIMESMEMHWSDADNLMAKAANLNPQDTQIWLVWGNMKRKNDKIKDAYSFYEKAYELSPEDNVVLNSYAQAISRLGDYEKADRLFIEALEMCEGTPHNRHLIINYTSIAENLKKWAEALAEDRNYKIALEKISKALDCITKVLRLDAYDVKANDLYRDVLYTYGIILQKQKEYEKAKKYLKKLVALSHNRYKEMEYNVRGNLALAEICVIEKCYSEIRDYLTKDVERNIKRTGKNQLIEKMKWLQEKSLNEESRKSGKIIQCNIERKYIIIEDEYGNTYLAFLSDFKEYVVMTEELLERSVSFIKNEDGGKKKACQIEFL